MLLQWGREVGERGEVQPFLGDLGCSELYTVPHLLLWCTQAGTDERRAEEEGRQRSEEGRTDYGNITSRGLLPWSSHDDGHSAAPGTPALGQAEATGLVPGRLW